MDVFACHNGPSEAWSQAGGFRRHTGGQLRPGQDPPQGSCHCIGIVVVDDDASATREQFNRVRKCSRHHGPPEAMASTSTPEVTWSLESYGKATTVLDWIRPVSDATSR